MRRDALCLLILALFVILLGLLNLWVSTRTPKTEQPIIEKIAPKPSPVVGPGNALYAFHQLSITPRDQGPVEERRRQPEAFGIDLLAKAIDRFADKLFGNGRDPGLKDDIAAGIREYTISIRGYLLLALAAIFFGFIIPIWWAAAGCHRQAVALETIALRMKQG